MDDEPFYRVDGEIWARPCQHFMTLCNPINERKITEKDTIGFMEYFKKLKVFAYLYKDKRESMGGQKKQRPVSNDEDERSLKGPKRD